MLTITKKSTPSNFFPESNFFSNPNPETNRSLTLKTVKRSLKRKADEALISEDEDEIEEVDHVEEDEQSDADEVSSSQVFFINF